MRIGEAGMSLIDERTIDDFRVWAKDNKDRSVFPEIYKAEKSYYMNRNLEETYLMEYSFHNMAELKEALAAYGGLLTDSWMLVKLVVEVCKNISCPKAEITEDKNSLSQKKELSVETSVKLSVKSDRNLRSEKTIEEFQEWAKEHKNDNIFSQISQEETSYYSNKSSEEIYLMEYLFQDMVWLKEALGEYSGLSVDPQMLKRVIVEMCRSRCCSELKANENEKNKEERIEKNIMQEDGRELPQYIYVF